MMHLGLPGGFDSAKNKESGDVWTKQHSFEAGPKPSPEHEGSTPEKQVPSAGQSPATLMPPSILRRCRPEFG
jgi:hypothetical protein